MFRFCGVLFLAGLFLLPNALAAPNTNPVTGNADGAGQNMMICLEFMELDIPGGGGGEAMELPPLEGEEVTLPPLEKETPAVPPATPVWKEVNAPVAPAKPLPWKKPEGRELPETLPAPAPSYASIPVSPQTPVYTPPPKQAYNKGFSNFPGVLPFLLPPGSGGGFGAQKRVLLAPDEYDMDVRSKNLKPVSMAHPAGGDLKVIEEAAKGLEGGVLQAIPRSSGDASSAGNAALGLKTISTEPGESSLLGGILPPPVKRSAGTGDGAVARKVDDPMRPYEPAPEKAGNGQGAGTVAARQVESGIPVSAISKFGKSSPGKTASGSSDYKQPEASATGPQIQEEMDPELIEIYEKFYQNP